MQLNKTQVRQLVRSLVDDPGGKFWNTQDLDLLTEGALDELWGELLDTFPWMRWTEVTPALNAPGTIDLSNTTYFQRPYRIQRVVRDSLLYTPVHPTEVLVAAGVALSAQEHSYTVMGSQLHLFPYSLTANAQVSYNSLPTRYTEVGGTGGGEGNDDDVAFVDWPNGYHMVYIYDIASRVMEKGDRENSTVLGRRSEQSMFRLKAYLRKFHIGPVQPQLPESTMDLGGV